jgi:hypothetical protein
MKWIADSDYPWLLVCSNCGHCIGEHGEDACPRCEEILDAPKRHTTVTMTEYIAMKSKEDTKS